MSVDYTTGEVVPAPLGPLAAALAKAQAAFPTVTRSKTVRVTTKTGGSYTFAYAPLDVILEAVRKPLADNGLVVVQLIDRESLVTVLLHESGASVEGRAPLPATADVQALGSAITYLRRYAIQALLGIAAEDDDDGNNAAGNRTDPVAKARRPAQAARTAQEPSKPAQPTPKQVAAQADELTDDDWGGIVTTEAEPVHPAEEAAIYAERTQRNGHAGPGLSSRDFFQRTDDAGIERGRVYGTAKKMYDRKVTDLSDEERLALLVELEPVRA